MGKDIGELDDAARKRQTSWEDAHYQNGDVSGDANNQFVQEGRTPSSYVVSSPPATSQAKASNPGRALTPAVQATLLAHV